MPQNAPSPASSATAHESHLRKLGLPLVIDPAVRLRQMLRRASGTNTGIAMAFTGFAAIDRANDYMIDILERQSQDAMVLEDMALTDPVLILLFLGLALVVVAPAVGALVAWIARRLSPLAGTLLGLGALLALIVVPPITFSPWDGPTAGTTAITAAGVLLGTYVGVWSLVKWGARRAISEIATISTMVARLLPVLMLAVLFLLFSAELWQVMVELSWSRTAALVGTVSALTVLLVTVTAQDDLNRELASEAPDLQLRTGERINLLLLPVIATLIQAVFFATLVYIFFLYLGWVAIPEATEVRWTLRPIETPTGLLAGLPVSVTMLRVALVLAAFSALNLAAAAASDAAHRHRFVQPIMDEAIHGLTAREAYLEAQQRR